MDPIVSFVGLLEGKGFIAYIILFLGSYVEIIAGPGLFIPGEIFFLGGSIIAGLGALNILLVFASCITGGVLGDSTNYWIGKRYGESFVIRFLKKTNRFFNHRNYNKIRYIFKKKGKKVILYARLLGPACWIIPLLAGTFKIKYKEFLKYNIPSVIIGIGQFLAIGYFFGFSYKSVIDKASTYIWEFLIASLIAILAYNYLLKLYVDSIWKKAKTK